MAEIIEERITEAVANIKAALSDEFQFSDIATILGEITTFAEVFSLSGPEKKELALRVAQRVLDETDIPVLPDKLSLPFVGEVGADALIMKLLPGLIDKLVGASKGKLALNVSSDENEG